MIKISVIVAIALMVSVALISGLLFSFTTAVSPGLKHLTDLEFLKAMKNINREILNPIFLLCFFSPILLFPATIYIQQNDNSSRLLLMAGFLTYLLVIVITATINVPLNNQLETFDLFNASQNESLAWRSAFENRWTFWNNVRTVLSVISLILLTLSQFETIPDAK